MLIVMQMEDKITAPVGLLCIHPITASQPSGQSHPNRMFLIMSVLKFSISFMRLSTELSRPMVAQALDEALSALPADSAYSRF